MAIVVYKCDVCKREIELQRNIRSMESIGRCTITNGCRGVLYQTKVLQDFIRGQLPDPVAGLDDWQQRRVLYNHDQAVERDEWVIVHNMGSFPVVTVLVDRPIEGDLDNREEIIPDDIRVIDEDAIVLQFSRPYSGIAQLVGRQSDPDLLRPITRIVEETPAPIQLSATGGELTIATLVKPGDPADLSNPLIGLSVLYSTTTGSEELIEYTADDQPDLSSPWVDFDRIVVRNQIYTVRSFNGIVPKMIDGTIGSGSTFRFTGVDPTGVTTFQPIEHGQVLLLLATSPFAIVDKIRDQFIDVTDVTTTQNPFGFYYDTGEFFAERAVTQQVYPLIRPI